MVAHGVTGDCLADEARAAVLDVTIGAFHEQWRHRRDPVPPLIAESTDATPKVLLDLFSSSLEGR